MVEIIVTPHLRCLNKHLVNVILIVSFVILIGVSELRILFLHIIEQSDQLLDIALTLLSLALLNIDDHMIDLLKTNIGLVLFANQSVYLMDGYLAFDIHLNFTLDMLIVYV